MSRVGGTAEEVAVLWAAGSIEAVNKFQMPGCIMGGCHHRHAGRGHHLD